MRTLTSSFTASTGHFEACISICLDADNNRPSLIPVSQIKKLMGVSAHSSVISFKDGTAQNIYLPLAELHQRLKTADAETGIIDLVKESMPILPPDDPLTIAFNSKCKGQAGIDYISVRCYATQHKKPDDSFELIAQYPKSGLSYLRNYSEIPDRCLVEFKKADGASMLLLVKIDDKSFTAMANEAFEKRQPQLDIRAETRLPYATVAKYVVIGI